MNVDLMELADCSTPEELARCILKYNPDLPIPIPIEDLAAAVGISEIHPFSTSSFEGSLTANAEKSIGTILYNAASGRRRTRFTIGHEIGHFLLPSHNGDTKCTSDDIGSPGRHRKTRLQEGEANEFAAQILMPAPHFRRDMRRSGAPDLEHVLEIADRYDTSIEATANRYLSLCDEVCALIFSINGRVRYWRRTESFPWIPLKKGDSLPHRSLSVAPPKGAPRTCSNWDEFDSGIWLDDHQPRHRVQAVLEQVLYQAGGFRVTLLQIADVPGDNDEDDAGLEESWAVHF